MTPQIQNPEPAATSPVEQLLAQLQGPATPEPIGLWPPAPGWWLATAIVIAAVVITAVGWHRQRISRRYRKTALTEFERIAALTEATEKVHALKALLKQTHFTAYPRSRNHVAAQHGKPWLEELHRTAKLHKLPYAQQQHFARYFSDEIYQADSELYSEKALHGFEQVCHYWLRHHLAQPSARNTTHKTARNSVVEVR